MARCICCDDDFPEVDEITEFCDQCAEMAEESLVTRMPSPPNSRILPMTNQPTPEDREALARACHEALSKIDVINYLNMPENTAELLAEAILAARPAPSSDVVEAVALAYAKAFYGPNFDPHLNPEAFDLAMTATGAALRTMKGEAK